MIAIFVKFCKAKSNNSKLYSKNSLNKYRFVFFRSRKLNTQLENAIQEAMMELDHTSSNNNIICKNQQQLQQQRVQQKQAIRASKVTQQNTTRQVTKAPIKIAPHPIKISVNNSLGVGNVGNIVSDNTALAQTNTSTINKLNIKPEDCVTARLRSASNNNNNQR